MWKGKLPSPKAYPWKNKLSYGSRSEAVLQRVSEPKGKAKAMCARIPKVNAEVALVTQ